MSHNALDFHSVHGRTSVSNISKYYRNILIKFSSRDKESHPVFPYWGSGILTRNPGDLWIELSSNWIGKNYIFISLISSCNSTIFLVMNGINKPQQNYQYLQQNWQYLQFNTILKILKRLRTFSSLYKNTVLSSVCHYLIH